MMVFLNRAFIFPYQENQEPKEQCGSKYHAQVDEDLSISTPISESR